MSQLRESSRERERERADRELRVFGVLEFCTTVVGVLPQK